jgi:ribosomal protein S18 acetylase RimI-like enzyme
MSETQELEKVPHYTIRPWRESDLVEVARVMQAAYGKTYIGEQPGVTAEDIAEHIAGWDSLEQVAEHLEIFRERQQNPKIISLMAEDGGKPVGFCRARFFEDNEVHLAGADATIEMLYVHPDYFGKGVAAELFEAVLSKIGHTAWIELEVVTHNNRAKNFYKKYGFEVLNPDSVDTEFELVGGKKIPEHYMLSKSRTNNL